MNTRLPTTASQLLTTLTAAAVLLLGGLATVRPARADINEQVAQLDLGKATLKDVIRIFGEPKAYAWEGKTFAKDSLPSVYVLQVTDDFTC